jgi:hypothetical protein
MLKFLLRSAPWIDGIDVNIAEMHPDGTISAATPLVFSKVEKGCVVGAPSLTINRESAQQMMDDLYSFGFRPTEMKASVGQVEAMRAHISNLQRIAFHDFQDPDAATETAISKSASKW